MASEFLIECLGRPVHRLASFPAPTDDPLSGEDSQLSLYLCYELHYRGLSGVDAAWEWEPSLLELRRDLEDAFEEALLRRLGPPSELLTDVPSLLRALIAEASGPSLSRYMVEHGTLEQMREFAVHRSGYQLKEADPHSWAIPRLSGRAKSALIEIQHDEYGQGRPGQAHAELFAATMSARSRSTRPTAPIWTGCPGRRWRRRTWCPSSASTGAGAERSSATWPCSR